MQRYEIIATIYYKISAFYTNLNLYSNKKETYEVSFYISIILLSIIVLAHLQVPDQS